MKKILVTALLVGVLSFGFATTETISDSAVLVDWDFEPEVETKAGFNLDSSVFGLIGSVSLDITSTIHGEASREYTGEGTNYGYIEIEDLEIIIDVGEEAAAAADGTTVTNPLAITWGSITGKVFIGPVYLTLAHDGHEEIEYLETLDDSSLDFTSMEYSVIPAYYTGTFGGATAYPAPTVSAPLGTLVIDPALDTTTGTVSNTALTQSNMGSASIGFEVPDVITVELGVSTQYTYYQRVSEYYNPYSVSLMVETTPVDNLSINLKGSMIDGYGNLPMMEEETREIGGVIDTYSNPVSAGLVVGYTVPLNTYNFTTQLGFEGQFVNKRKIGGELGDGIYQQYFAAIPEVTALDFGGRQRLTDRVLSMPVEAALGFTFDWSSLGIEDSEEGFDFAADDFDATDGVSLSGIFGMTPTGSFAEYVVPYIGAKIALYDSEDTDKPGIIPGFYLASIINVNYVLGGSADVKGTANEAANAANAAVADPFTEFDLSSTARMDIGGVLEGRYKGMNYVQPYAGVIYKTFDFTDDFEYKVSAKSVALTQDTAMALSYANQTDLRAQIGFDIVDIVSNTTFTVEWQSGDLIEANGDQAIVNGDPYSADYGYYMNEGGDINGQDVMNTYTQAKLGFISLGVNISF